MTLRRPSKADLASISEKTGIDLTEAEVEVFYDLVCGNMELYDTLEQVPDPVREVTPAVRIPGARPQPSEDPLNGVVRTCSVKAVNPTSDKLAGKTIGIKDTVCIAGLPMTCASRLLYDYTPDIDATVIKRILEAGGHITAVLNTDDFAFSGGGHTSAYGVGLNPANPEHSAGGSSCGSAIAPATGIVDIALGGDQGGSIRIPASWSGIVGLKPTHGLVPYTGIAGFDRTIDHIGPMARTVEDAALMLSVIAGKDDTCLDVRQPSTVPVGDYLSGLNDPIKGMRIAVVKEGFGTPDSLKEVDEAVFKAARVFEKLGATVTEISIPEHRLVPPLWNCIAIEGGIDSFYHGHQSYGVKEWYNPRLMSAMSRAIKTNGGDFSPTAKLGVLIAHYMKDQYHGVFYGRAQNLSRHLTQVYDAVFGSYDLVLMPTTPQTAHAIPPSPEADRRTHIVQALNMVCNTAAFDLTGHPSISVPAHDKGKAGLPVGVMLTGPNFSEANILRAANAYTRAA